LLREFSVHNIRKLMHDVQQAHVSCIQMVWGLWSAPASSIVAEILFGVGFDRLVLAAEKGQLTTVFSFQFIT